MSKRLFVEDGPEPKQILSWMAGTETQTGQDWIFNVQNSCLAVYLAVFGCGVKTQTYHQLKVNARFACA